MIDFTAINASLKKADQAFTFIGTGKFSNTASELRYEKAKADTYVYGAEKLISYSSLTMAVLTHSSTSAVEYAGMRDLVEGQKIGFELERDKKSGKMSACNLQAD